MDKKARNNLLDKKIVIIQSRLEAAELDIEIEEKMERDPAKAKKRKADLEKELQLLESMKTK